MFSKNKVENSHFILSEINSKLSLYSDHTTHNQTGPKFGILVQPKYEGLHMKTYKVKSICFHNDCKKQNCTFTQRGLLVHLMEIEESFIPGGRYCVLRSLNILSWAPACTYKEHASLHRASAGVRQHIFHNGRDKYYYICHRSLETTLNTKSFTLGWLNREQHTWKGMFLLRAVVKRSPQKSMLPRMSQVLSILTFTKINTFQSGNLILFWTKPLWSG